MKIFDPKLTGSIEILNTISGNVTIAGGLNVVGSLGGSATTASYVEYSDVVNKPTLISSSVQIASDISGSTTFLSSSIASERLKNTTDTLDGDLTVTGKITAQEFHTEFVSASIIFQSGSTKFGDSSDDVHSFTGSLNLSGSLQATSLIKIGGTSSQFLKADGSIDSTGYFPLSGGNITGNLSVDTNVLFVDTVNDRVGIGTSGPAEKLNINGNIRVSTGGIIYTENPAGGRYGSFYTNADGTILQSFGELGEPLTLSAPSSTGRIAFATAGNESMRITSAGNVNIGTTGPTSSGRLNIETNGASQIETGIRLINPYGFASASTGVQIVFAQDRSEGEDFTMAVIRSGQGASGTSNEGDLRFFTRASGTVAERMRIQSGGGISFNGDTAADNALDDYEEGTWTPTVTASSSNPTVAYSHRTGKYTKIGNIVSVYIAIDFSISVAGSGQLNLSLPFPAATFAANYQHYQVGYYPTGMDENVTTVGAIWGSANLRLYSSINAGSTNAASLGRRAFAINLTYFV